jgi:putative endonuclease
MKFLGDNYEAIAASYLRKHKAIIVTQNYRTKFGEIDIIARDSNTLLFVEVKGRKAITHGEPSEFVSSKKQAKIIKAAEEYLQLNNLFDTDCRFDVITIVGCLIKTEPKRRLFFSTKSNATTLTIDWIKNAYQQY